MFNHQECNLKSSETSTKPSRSISSIWVVPLIALIIAASLAFRAWQKKGVEVEIIFDNANGIQVGRTEIRLKDVPIGKVTKMRLTQDLGKVRVMATIDRQVGDHLSVNSRFWLVSPRVSTSGVSNLGTLISGVYIVMDPGKAGGYHTVFEGLTEPPAVQSDELGTQFVLLADRLGSLDIGSPIYYRQLRVGEITGYKLAEGGNYVELRVWVDAPHDQLVQTNSRFWNVSGFDFKFGAEGLKVEMASLASLINGGVAFENMVAFDAPQNASSGHEFYLYDNRDSVMEERYTLKYYYRLRFTHSVKGLNVGAPVEFRGIKVGEVVDVTLNSVDSQPNGLQVFISMEPQRLDSAQQPSREEFDQHIAELVEQGMRAQLRTANLITGSRFVDLSFPNQPPPGEFQPGESFADLPTLDSPAEDLEQQVASIARKINSIPLDELGQDLSMVVKQLSQTLATLNRLQTIEKIDTTLSNVSSASEHFDDVMRDAQTTLRQVGETMESLDQVMAPDSQVQYQLREALQSLQQTSQALNRLLENLNKKPDALIFGN